MAVEFSWDLNNLECAISVDGLSNVVQTIHWRLIGRDGDIEESIAGATSLKHPESAVFINFSELTPDIVKGWLLKELADAANAHNAPTNEDETPPVDKTVSEIEAELKGEVAMRIEKKKAPKVVVLSAPWA